ncbi:AMP-binding protein [Natronomonas sp. CBA1123]|uniref:AMP-binding protein n=1 Tax=Natronomonas sp. CBA1123 TaxID=2668070 RepID=UPI0018D20A27
MRDWLATRADGTPEATAVAAGGDVVTPRSYADLNERVEVLAGRLAARGVGVDDALAVCAETRIEFLEAVHAAQRLGGGTRSAQRTVDGRRTRRPSRTNRPRGRRL